ncbi:hypothetical protein Cgig2_027300 [Carnegiea gigantea]|uniref:SMAX1-like nucleotide binding domain-containing protein n=1 Tax=Carnegiea gigantea TaxID=171969 RepID=A0A9Q1JW44_9CARY|nr:hypothetical protein Cgig2_027300 [Carnegiea gigantea]
MREAGFSSTLVKGKVEQAMSLELASQNHVSNNDDNNNNNNNNNNNRIKPEDQGSDDSSSNLLSVPQSEAELKTVKPQPSDQGGVRNEDVMSVMESFMSSKKRNSLVVGECVETLEGIVREVIDRVKNGVNNDKGLKGLKFVQFSVSSFVHLSREEVDQRVGELNCLVKSCVGNDKWVVLYLGDLNWATNEFRSNSGGNYNNIPGEQHRPRRSSSCPIEHIGMEIEKFVLGYIECGKLWLLGIVTFQTYMRCKSGQPSLEASWGLHAITIPSGSLSLSLLPDGDPYNPLISSKKAEMSRSWLMPEGQGSSTLMNMEAQSPKAVLVIATVSVKDQPKRWGLIYTLAPQSPSTSSFERTLSFSSISPSSTSSNFAYDLSHLKLQPSHQNIEPRNIWVNEPLNKTHEKTFTLYIQDHEDHPRQEKHYAFISSDPNSTPTSTSSSDIMNQMESQCISRRFKEYTAENVKTLCHALEKNVPHYKDAIYDVVSTVLHCRSGMTRRKGCHEQRIKEETWLFFQGVDLDAKEKVARELARLIFRSQEKFVPIGLSSFSSTREDSLEDSRNKRLRDEQSCSYMERFAEAVSSDPHRVFFIEDIKQADYSSQIGIKKAIERGRIPTYVSGEEVSFCDAIIILSCESFSSRSRACSPSIMHKADVQPEERDQKITNKGDASQGEITSPSISLDLNISINDEDGHDDANGSQSQSIDEIGLLASVDRCIIFKNHHEF